MFTGIIIGTGKVESFRRGGGGGVLLVRPLFPIGKLGIGESVALDGCCLTVIKKNGRLLSFDISDETVRKTTMSGYKKGTIVNLERPLKPSDRLGGHFVLGHVDGLGKISQIKKNKGSVEIEISYHKQLASFLIDKGSVAVDGISLTACLSGANKFKVYIIPHTLKLTNLNAKKVGDSVNLEGDVLGKYVERLILLGKKWYGESRQETGVSSQ